MTPREIHEMAEGWRWRMERTRELLAWHAANVMNSSGMMKRKVTPQKLLGRSRDLPEAKDADIDWTEMGVKWQSFIGEFQAAWATAGSN